MLRFLAGAAACFLMMTGAFLLWQGRAQDSALPPAPEARPAGSTSLVVAQPIAPPEASPKSREELLAPRRKAFAKLDRNGNGALSFEEWAVKTVDKFGGADKDRNGVLTPVEYATTAPPPPKKKRCAC